MQDFIRGFYYFYSVHAGIGGGSVSAVDSQHFAQPVSGESRI